MELLKRFTEGDVEAFETLFREFQGPVYGWIIRIVRDTGIAEDLTLETFWWIYKGRERFDPEATFGAWARRIATNVALDHVGRRRSEQGLFVEPIQDDSGNPALQRERREQIRSAFRRLPPKLQIAATCMELAVAMCARAHRR
jgi:RNA polymerase sigma-70 factor (ECF subfamily)